MPLPLSAEHEDLRQLMLLKALETKDPVAANAAALLGMAGFMNNWENIFPVLRGIHEELTMIRSEINIVRNVPASPPMGTVYIPPELMNLLQHYLNR